jgi:hypothetical protein
MTAAPVLSADFSGCSSIGDFIDDTSAISASTTSSTSTFEQSLPRNFRQLLDGSLIGDDELAASGDVASRRSTRSQAASGRRVDRPSARKLQFNDCSPMVAHWSTPLGVARHRKTVKSPSVTSFAEVEKRLCPVDVCRIQVDDSESRDGYDDVTTALARSDDQLHNLIGDLSGEHVLPLAANGKHADLKTISPDTVSSLHRMTTFQHVTLRL